MFATQALAAFHEADLQSHQQCILRALLCLCQAWETITHEPW